MMQGQQGSGTEAWIEAGPGQRYPIENSCAFGRSQSNNVVLVDDNVSRRHAMIHSQGQGIYWIIDLGSANGTYVNGRRVNQPCRLNHGDRIDIGGRAFTFHCPKDAQSSSMDRTTQATMENIRSTQCWMLVADIESSTELVRKLSPSEASQATGLWLSQCRKIIDSHHGAINKFLGDGFFAYWIHGQETAPKVAEALKTLRHLQEESDIRFRLVLHFGQISVGGSATLGEDNLFGAEVNFVFRMEKTAGGARIPCMLSEAAHRHLNALLATTDQGRLKVASFEGEHLFFSHP